MACAAVHKEEAVERRCTFSQDVALHCQRLEEEHREALEEKHHQLREARAALGRATRALKKRPCH